MELMGGGACCGQPLPWLASDAHLDGHECDKDAATLHHGFSDDAHQLPTPTFRSWDRKSCQRAPLPPCPWRNPSRSPSSRSRSSLPGTVHGDPWPLASCSWLRLLRSTSYTECELERILSCFFNDLADVGNLILGSSAFSKTSLNIWKFTVHVLLKPGLDNFEYYFASIWDECNCVVVWALPFLGIGMKIDLFQSCGHCRVFQVCWHIECSTLTASSFQDLK